MAAITTMDGIAAGLQGQERKGFHKGSFTPAVAGGFYSLWLTPGQPGPGAAPGSLNGAVPTDVTAGSFPFTNAVGDNYLGYVACTGLAVGTLVIYDRLWANSTTNVASGAQAITFPGLTRYTSGIGVECWLEWYVASSATAATATATYTDQDGNTGSAGTITLPAVAKAAGQMFPMDMVAGDSGIRAVSSMNIGTTHTGGTWGLTFMKRLAEIPIRPSDQGASALNIIDLGMPDITDDACLAFMFQGAASANTLAGSLGIAKSL
jgi:hypothetical protein